MQSIRNVLLVSLLVAPSLLRGDATIRYKTEMTSSLPMPRLADSSSAIYMKGNKGVSVSDGQTTIADFAKQEITIIDNDRKKFATIPAAEKYSVQKPVPSVNWPVFARQEQPRTYLRRVRNPPHRFTKQKTA